MSNKKAPGQSYLEYSALGIQIALIAGVMAYAGYRLDKYMGNDTPWFTLLFSILGVAGAMIKLIRSISKM